MHTVGIVVFPGFQILHIALATVFEFANMTLDQPHYAIELLSENGGAIPSSAGFAIATSAFEQRSFDTVIVAGDNVVIENSPALLQFLREASATSRRIAGACTGAFALAQAGLLDGRRATTHWYHAQAFRETFPTVKMEDDRIFIVDGRFWTSAGGTAGLDLALALVEKDLGVDIARLVAKKLVMSHRRSGGQAQFSALLQLDPKSDRIQSALTWAQENLRGDLSVERMAQAARLSPRQFSRAFRQETGQSPARAVERLRVEAAKIMMEVGRHGIDAVAQESGFGDPERMRRAFLRAYGQPPQAVRRAARAHVLQT